MAVLVCELKPEPDLEPEAGYDLPEGGACPSLLSFQLGCSLVCASPLE